MRQLIDCCDAVQAVPVVTGRRIGAVVEQVPRGSRLRFALSEAARVTAVATRRGSRRRVGRFVLPGEAGRNARRFAGRIRWRALRPGRYRLTLRATDTAGNRSRVRRTTFTVVRR